MICSRSRAWRAYTRNAHPSAACSSNANPSTYHAPRNETNIATNSEVRLISAYTAANWRGEIEQLRLKTQSRLIICTSPGQHIMQLGCRKNPQRPELQKTVRV